MTKANELCIWNNDCSIQNTSGCPINSYGFDPMDDYKKTCSHFINRGEYSKECPPHLYEKEVLFQVPRFYCQKCQQEWKPY